ncbi:MAG: hypothetical protein Q9219_005618 [cf. Caloplaca sp. 3 TL-2023]
MAAPAADRWFIPDGVYRAQTDDYAVVGMAADTAKRQVECSDNAPRDSDLCRCNPYSFRDALKQRLIGPFGYGGYFPRHSLIFADVDQADPAHEKDVRTKRAAAQELDKATEKGESAEGKLVKTILEGWKQSTARDPDDHVSEERDTELSVKAYLERCTYTAPPRVLQAMMELDQEERREALMLLSDQGTLPLDVQRPVLILVGTVDTAQTTVLGTGQGYKIAFDPLSKELIIMPYESSPEKHPLGDKWFADIPADGISFKGPIKDFILNCFNFADDVLKNEVRPTEPEGFKYLVYAYVTDWIYKRYFLVAKDLKEEALSLAKYVEQYDELDDIFAEVNFPNKKRVMEEKAAKADYLDHVISQLKMDMEVNEPNLRYAAVEAKRKGKEKKAEAAAEVWDTITQAIKKYETLAVGDEVSDT